MIDAGKREEMRGRDQISQWIGKSISGLHLQSDVRGWKEENGEWIVDTVLTGNFKASPARLEYFISRLGDRISKLRVEFRDYVTMFAGRLLSIKRAQAIVRHLEPFGVPPGDVRIILNDIPLENVGMRGGKAAADLELGYEVSI